MMNKMITKVLVGLSVSTAMIAGQSIFTLAEEKPITSDVTIPEVTEAGVFVNEDEGSATGYTVTFVYESPDAESVQLDIGANLFKPGSRLGAEPSADKLYTPYEWDNTMFGCGFEGYITDLTKVEGTDLWSISLPLAHALYQYNYVVDGETVDDPTNPRGKNPNPDGGEDGDCTVYVPLNAEKQPNADDYSYLNKETVTNPGELTYVSYTDVNGNSAPLGVYLPADYDENREEPYKVLYVSHGSGASEVNWFGCGRLNTEYDHLIEDGKVEPTVVVTMNNQNYEWNMDIISDNLMNAILPYVEENYNVSKEASGRGFCGLSAGGATTSSILVEHANDFGYFGIFSGSRGGLDYSSIKVDGEQPVIMIGYGLYDFGFGGSTFNPESTSNYHYSGSAQAAIGLEQAGFTVGVEEVRGAHDWYTWPHLMYIFAENYLWK